LLAISPAANFKASLDVIARQLRPSLDGGVNHDSVAPVHWFKPG
jgi:hypothetical protein